MIREINKKDLDEIFDRNTDPGRCLMELFVFAIPEDMRVNEWPKVGEELNNYLLRQFERFSEDDRDFWARQGFKMDRKLGPWEIKINVNGLIHK
jgi:hypothetical protein